MSIFGEKAFLNTSTLDESGIKEENRKMETKSKVLIGTVLALLVVLPLISTAWAIPAYNSRIKNASMAPAAVQKEELQRGAVAWFFKDAEVVTIDGTVVTRSRNILIVDSEGKRLNILLPPLWSVNTEDKVLNLSAIFKENYVKAGDTVTITALERTVRNEKGVSVSFIVAYEILDETTDNHLYAILPFNIATGD